MDILEKNLNILKENFHYHEIDKLDEGNILALIPQEIGRINANNIEI